MFLAVAAGAFGAHALKARLTPEMLAVFEVGVRYHLTHGLALLAVALAAAKDGGAATQSAGIAFICGIILFSGSLYALSLTGLRWMGVITPIGGGFFLLGWGALAWSALAGRTTLPSP